jgi:hypothetical protein
MIGKLLTGAFALPNWAGLAAVPEGIIGEGNFLPNAA